MPREKPDDQQLLRELERVASRSEVIQARLDRIVNIEQTRRRNLELRVEVMTRTRGS